MSKAPPGSRLEAREGGGGGGSGGMAVRGPDDAPARVRMRGRAVVGGSSEWASLLCLNVREGEEVVVRSGRDPPARIWHEGGPWWAVWGPRSHWHTREVDKEVEGGPNNRPLALGCEGRLWCVVGGPDAPAHVWM